MGTTMSQTVHTTTNETPARNQRRQHKPCEQFMFAMSTRIESETLGHRLRMERKFSRTESPQHLEIAEDQCGRQCAGHWCPAHPESQAQILTRRGDQSVSNAFNPKYSLPTRFDGASTNRKTLRKTHTGKLHLHKLMCTKKTPHIARYPRYTHVSPHTPDIENTHTNHDHPHIHSMTQHMLVQE